MCDSGFNLNRTLGGDPTGRKGFAGFDMDLSRDPLAASLATGLAAILTGGLAAPYIGGLMGSIPGIGGLMNTAIPGTAVAGSAGTTGSGMLATQVGRMATTPGAYDAKHSNAYTMNKMMPKSTSPVFGGFSPSSGMGLPNTGGFGAQQSMSNIFGQRPYMQNPQNAMPLRYFG